MTFIVFSLIFIFLTAVFLGVALRAYLRQEQDKVNLPTKYDIVEEEIYRRKQIHDKRFDKTFAPSNLFYTNFDSFLLFRSMLFLSTYVLAMIATFVIIISRIDPLKAVYLVFVLPPSFYLFPLGLFAFLTKQFSNIPNEILLSFFTFLIYFSISSLAIFIKHKSIFTVLYVSFLILLIMNVVGCSIYVPIQVSQFK